MHSIQFNSNFNSMTLLALQLQVQIDQIFRKYTKKFLAEQTAVNWMLWLMCFSNKTIFFLLKLMLKYPIKIRKNAYATVVMKPCVTMHVHLSTATPTPGKRTGNKPPRSSFLCLLNVLQHEQTHIHTHFLDSSVQKFTGGLPIRHIETHTFPLLFLFLSFW